MSTQSSQRAGAWDVLAALVLVLLSSIVTLAVGEKSYDDAYITYRYATNLALGRGFVYNVGDAWLGTTTPLLAMLLALGARVLSVDLIPQIGQWLSGFALFSCALLVYLLARTDHKPVAAWVSALLLVLNPIFPGLWGGEALLLLALVLAGVLSFVQGREALAGIVLALAYLTRGEGALAAVALAVHCVAVQRRVPWRFALGFGMVGIPWTTYACLAFGSPFPSTLQAKIAQMQSGHFSPFLMTSVRRMAGYVLPGTLGSRESSLVYLVVVVLAVVGGLSLLRHPGSRHWLVLVWLVLYVLGYSLLDVPFYHWYMAPLVLGGMILAGLGAQTVWEWFEHRRGRLGPVVRRGALLAGALLLAAPLARAAISLWDLAHRPPSRAQRLYSNVGSWLRQNTLPDETVGYFEIGFIGFYGDRTMVDPVGLATPGASEHVAHGDFFWAYLEHQPDYLLVNPVRWYARIGRIRVEPWFNDAYREVARIDEPGYFDSPLRIYRKNQDAVIPEPSSRRD